MPAIDDESLPRIEDARWKWVRFEGGPNDGQVVRVPSHLKRVSGFYVEKRYPDGRLCEWIEPSHEQRTRGFKVCQQFVWSVT